MAEPAVTDRGATATEETKATPADRIAFMALVRKRFDRAASAESENRKQAVDDLKFKQGDQWPDQIKSQRTIEKRPCLTVNKMKTFTHQITNDQRQNRPGINISPIGDKADKNTAEMLRGLIRHIERQSNADVAYDTGFDGAVSNGFGFWRIVAEYENERSDNQTLRIMRVRNPFRIYLDPDHQQPDGSDAKWAFVTDMIPRAEFRESYPDAELVDWDSQSMGDEWRNWVSATHVRVAEYFYFETKKRKLLRLVDGELVFEDELTPELKAVIDANPQAIVKSRESESRALKRCVLSGFEVLEENDLPGKWIPIVKVIGDEVDVEGKVTYAGMIRDAKDSQRMYNFWVTAETEQVALMPKAPYIMEEGQVEGHEQRWQQANQKNYPYLLYKGTNVAGKQAPAPQRQPFAGPPQGVIAAKIAAAQDMQATTGIRFDATMQERMYDESGKALRELKRVGDLGNFHYVDNLARSLRHTGRILVDLIPKYYDTPRVVTILREDGAEETARIEPSLGVAYQTRPGAQGKVERLYNPSLGEYDVAVTIGPSFATKRAEAADSMLGFMQAVPQSAPIIGDLIAKNMDWPGAEEIAARMASMLPPQVLGQKGIDHFPPEARAMLGSLQRQLQQLTEQHKMAVAELGDKQADRAVQMEKISKDFEAKLTDIAAKMQIAVLDNVTKRLDEISGQVVKMEEMFRSQGDETAIIEMARRAAEGISGMRGGGMQPGMPAPMAPGGMGQ